MPEHKRYVIGIDGGGSKTHAILTGMDGTVLAESNGGPTNIFAVGIKQAATVLLDLILQCTGKVECDAQALESIVAGIAGAGRASDRNELIDTLVALAIKKKFPIKKFIVETDARISLEAAFAGGPGIVVVSGTGSVALYRTEDGKLLRAGGWGKIVGDEGSGFAIARDAVNAVLRQSDGRGEKTLLSKSAFEHFGVATVDELITKIYHDHADVPSFAPKVFDVAAERDRIAQLILTKNAHELTEHVRVLIMQSRPKQKLSVALMGGLLESENAYSKMVKEKIRSSLPQVAVMKPKFPAAFGAVILGLNAFR